MKAESHGEHGEKHDMFTDGAEAHDGRRSQVMIVPTQGATTTIDALIMSKRYRIMYLIKRGC
jgi:hypothetical protein